MDDFLHNLRSGKLKQPDRSNRTFNDQQYKGGQRRPMMDRRKFDNKDSTERLNVLKDVLDNLAESQKRIADAMEVRNKAEYRKTNALEILAKHILQILQPNADNSGLFGDLDSLAEKPSVQGIEMDAPAPLKETLGRNRADEPSESAEADVDAGDDDTKPGLSSVRTEAIQIDMEENDESGAMDAVDARKAGKLTIIDQQTLFPIISRMRDAGESWERIARHIADKGYPTLSGKGIWRGVMVKNLYEKLTA